MVETAIFYRIQTDTISKTLQEAEAITTLAFCSNSGDKLNSDWQIC
jgi:hypothetical protein